MNRREIESKRYLTDEESHEIRQEENMLKGLSIQEAIEYNKNLREYMKITDRVSKYQFLQENYEALDMAIKALERTELNPSYIGVKSELEPWEDYISRAEALKHSHIEYNDDGEGHRVIYAEDIEDLPPVIPELRVGHWITARTFMHHGEYYCDRCKCCSPNNEKWDYCPNCGSAMEVEI